MQIDETVRSRQRRKSKGKTPASTASKPKTAKSLRKQKALEAEDINAQAVQEARKALRSGELDTPQAARRAAEALLKHGL